MADLILLHALKRTTLRGTPVEARREKLSAGSTAHLC